MRAGAACGHLLPQAGGRAALHRVMERLAGLQAAGRLPVQGCPPKTWQAGEGRVGPEGVKGVVTCG
ncbi:hypothetical protein ADL27_41075 [Streptomyces sp. NRRL F-6602]|nr:hypothetical protein ADL27_41075 [Streptomyces sp. NRRL F-6602]